MHEPVLTAVPCSLARVPVKPQRRENRSGSSCSAGVSATAVGASQISFLSRPMSSQTGSAVKFRKTFFTKFQNLVKKHFVTKFLLSGWVFF